MFSSPELSFEDQLEQRLQDRLDRGGITQEEFDNIKNKFGNDKPHKSLHPPQIIIIVIFLVWLGVGIRQWIVLSNGIKNINNSR